MTRVELDAHIQELEAHRDAITAALPHRNGGVDAYMQAARAHLKETISLLRGAAQLEEYL